MGKLKTTAAGSATDDRMRNKRRAEDVDGDGVKVSKYEDQAPEQAKTFMQHDFGLDRRLIKAVAKMGFVYPTLVQSQCIPLALKGKDLLVRARTGSGKTAAFALPLLQKILRRKEAEPELPRGVRAVVLVPTRELCEQARAHLSELMHYCRDCVSLLALVDDNMPAQQAALRDRADILVATPARLVAHLQAGNVELKETVETLVVDEADLVLSFGYSDDIRSVTACLPKICQGFLMSATLSPELEDLKRVVLHSPAVLKLEEGTRDGRLTQFYLPVQHRDDKFLVVFAFIKLGLLEGKGLFFVNQTESSYRLKLFLEQFHVRSAVLNAELPLNSRLHILQEFNRGIFDYLIVTDDSMDVKSRRSRKSSSAVSGGSGGGVKMSAGTGIRVSSSVMLDEEDDDDGDVSAMSEDEEEEGKEDDDAEDETDGTRKAQTKRKISHGTKASREASDGEEQSSGNDDDDDDDDSEDSEDSEDDDGEEEEEEEENSAGKIARDGGKKTGGSGGGNTGEYGVARGVDFRGVSFVLNVDFPPTESSYTHRIGRTARAGASGTALSLVLVKDPVECRTLQHIQETQPALVAPSLDAAPTGKRAGRKSIVAEMGAQGAAETGGVVPGQGGGVQPQPAPLAFDVREIERFRYRVEDTLKKVTRVTVREARAAELKAEMLNSERLEGYFKEHAGDLRVLRHDKSVLHPLRKLDHLKHIPAYLMPAGLQTGEDPTKRQRKRLKRQRGGVKRRSGHGEEQGRRKDNDPLQTFAADELGQGGENEDEGETAREIGDRLNEERKSRVMQTNDFAGESTSGRRRWQQRRGRGKHGGGGKRKPKKTSARFDLPV